MALLEELPLWLRATLKLYPWRTLDPVPHATLKKPIERCRVALLTTGGLVPPGLSPFDQTVRGGDFSSRLIRGDVEVASLTESHRSDSFDHTGVEADQNLAFPLDRLRGLAASGEIGEVAPRHFSFMGSLTAPGRLIKQTAPAAADIPVEDQVDIALLVPVWPFCHQAVGLVQGEIERRGIVTASITMLPEVTRKMRAPRALSVPYRLGFALGEANAPGLQRDILRRLLSLVRVEDVPHLAEFELPLAG